MSRLGKTLLYAVALASVALFAFTGTVRAQGSRKDDIVLNGQGRPMAGASVRVCTSTATGQPCSPLASIFSDPGLTQALANPIATDGLGNYSLYAAPGKYEIEISGPGITTKQLPNVILPNDPSSPTFTTVTTTSGISAFSLSLTGNLTVSGSTAVTGTLSVGGVPVPSTAQENQWTASQHFKGPNPWRDFTAYMKDSNGNPVNCSSTTPVNGADTTGTISSGSTTLTLAAARDFKNGCGIAVLGAGPTATLPAPPMTATVSSAARAGSTTVTLTFSGTPPAGFPAPYIGPGDIGLVVSGCSVGAYNGTFPIQTATSGSGWQITYISGSSATDSATSCTVSFLFGYAHGTTGSTTYNYKIVAIDQNMGYSAASSTVTITNGNATLSKDNYNWIAYPFNLSAVEYALYGDKGLGGALTCVAVSFTMAVTDNGTNNPCPPFLPANPPGSAGPQTLNTTITSGAGTTTLTLAASASNTATNQNVYHDESSFLNSCITDTNNAMATGFAGDYGCYVPPAGSGAAWDINGPLLTGSLQPNAFLHIHVAGVMNFQTTPWFIKGQYQIYGVSGGGSGGATAEHTGATKINFSNTAVPGGFIFRTGSSGAIVSGFQTGYVNGPGVWIGATDPSNAPSGVQVDHVSINEQFGGSAGIVIDNNVIGAYFEHDTVSGGSTSGGMPAIYITHTAYGSAVDQFLFFTDMTSLSHTVKIDMPGGNVTGANVHNIKFDTWFGENNFETGFIQVDGGANAPGVTGGLAVAGITLNHVVTSDGGVTAMFNQSGTSTVPIQSATINESGGTAKVTCNTAAACIATPGVSGFLSVNSGGNMGSYGKGLALNVGSTQNNLNLGPFGIVPATVNMGGNPAYTNFTMYLPPLYLTVSSTGAGSLASGVWCAVLTGLDLLNNETDGGPPICQTVAVSSSISYSWTQGNSSSLAGAYNGFNFYFCTVASGVCNPNNKITGIAAGATSYTFSSTSGSTSTSPPLNSAAMLSWLGTDRDGSVNTTGTPWSCFFCVNANSDHWPVGIGILPTSGQGYNLYTKLGVNVGGKLTIAGNGTGPAGQAQQVGSTACTPQSALAPVTGTGAYAIYFTCTIPANVIGAGKGIKIFAWSKHTTGSTGISYQLSFGGTTTTPPATPAGSANQTDRIEFDVLNASGVQNSQTIETILSDSNSGTNFMRTDTGIAVNTANSVVINVQFNVANTDAITPEEFWTELIQ